jgi:hypothetical protein
MNGQTESLKTCKEIQGRDSIIYALNHNGDFSEIGYKVIRSGQIPELLRCEKYLYNGGVRLLYATGGLSSLDEKIASLNKNGFVAVIVNAFKLIKRIKENGFIDLRGLDIADNKIFIDSGSLAVRAIYLPVTFQGQTQDPMNPESRIRAFFIKKISESEEKFDGDTSLLISLLSDSKRSIDEILQTLKDYGNIKEQEEGPFRGVILTAEDIGVSFDISKERFTIGRSPNHADGVIRSGGVSGLHCIVETRADGCYIADAGSTNGTFLNGRKIAKNIFERIDVGDSVIFADVKFVVGAK